MKNNKEIIYILATILFLFSGLFVFYFFFNWREKVDERNNLGSIVASIKPDKKNIGEIKIEAKAGLVVDLNSEEILFEKNSNKPLPLASLTKIMTAVVASEYLNPKDIVNIDENGNQNTFQELLDTMLVSSNNDSANTIAKAAGYKISNLLETDPVGVFVKKMNQKGKDLGLKNTTFYNPTGLDLDLENAGATGSAYDFYKLLKYALEQNISSINKTRNDHVYVNGSSTRNTNSIVSDLPNIIASKTGLTDLAGGNLAVVIDPGLNKPFVLIALGSSESGRFNDIKKMSDAVLDFLSNEK